MQELQTFETEFHQNEDFSTPFIPKDYNKYTFECQIEKDYLVDSGSDTANTTDGEHSDLQTPFNLRKQSKNTDKNNFSQISKDQEE